MSVLHKEVGIVIAMFIVGLVGVYVLRSPLVVWSTLGAFGVLIVIDLAKRL